MSTRRLAVMVATTTMLTGAGLTQAQSAGDYRSGLSGEWDDVTSWERYTGSAWVTASTPPQSGTVLTVRNGHAIEICDTGIDHSGGSLTIESGGSLVIEGGNRLTIDGASLTVNGSLVLEGSGSALKFTNSATISGSGYVQGQHNAAEIDIVPASSALTLTLTGKIRGQLFMQKSGAGSGAANFTNSGTVSADRSGALKIASNMGTVSGAGAWKIENNSSAVLQFDVGATFTNGTLHMLTDGGGTPHGGTFVPNGVTVTFTNLVYNFGTISPSSGSLCFANVSGSCGSAPSSCVSASSAGCP